MNRMKLLASFCLGMAVLGFGSRYARHGLASWGSNWTNYTYDKDVLALAVSGNTVWAGTWGGLLRWDLVSSTYTKYTVADGLPSIMINDVETDGLGRVWVATDKGLSKLEGTTWTNYIPQVPYGGGTQACEQVNKLAITNDNKVWLRCFANSPLVYGPQGVTLFDGVSTWTTYNESNSAIPDDDIRSLVVDKNNHLWIGTWDGDASELIGSSWTNFANINGGDNEIWAIAVDSLNRKWFVSYMPAEQQVIVYDGLTWTPHEPENGCSPFLNDVAIDSNNVAWFTVPEGGLCSFDGSTWTRYHTGNSSIANNNPGDVETEGNKVYVGYGLIWGGFSERNGSTWRYFNTTTNLPDDASAPGLAGKHKTWFGGGHGVYSYDGTNWTAYTSAPLSNICYQTIARDRTGHLWFAGGACGGGLVEYDDQSTWTQHYNHGVTDSFVYAIAVGDDNRVWAGWRLGMGVYNHSSWQTYTYTDMGLPNGTNVDHIAIDGNGNAWVNCTTRFNGTGWFTYTTKEEAIQNNFNPILNTVAEDKHCWLADPDRGRVWLEQTTRSGVKYYNGSGWTTISNASMGFTSPPAWYAYLEGIDRAGNLWVKMADPYSHGGLSRFDGTDWTSYRATDGVIEPPSEMTIEHSGRVWFWGSKGFSIYSNLWQPQKRTLFPEQSKVILSIDGSTSVTFPQGAVSQITTITYTTTQATSTGSLTGIGHFFDMSAVISGTNTPVTSFNKTYTITVEYTDVQRGPAIESTLSLYSWNGSSWSPVPSNRDPVNNVVTAVLDHMTRFAVLGETYRSYLPGFLR